MKRIFSILLSFLFLFNCCGYIFAYYQLKFIFREEAVERISNGCMPDEIIAIDDSPRLEKLGDDEIRYEGVKYDIISTIVKNGKVVFYCLSDEKETLLDQTLINHVESNQDSPATKPVKNILRNIFSDLILPDHILVLNKFLKNENPYTGVKLYCPPDKEVPCRPPIYI